MHAELPIHCLFKPISGINIQLLIILIIFNMKKIALQRNMSIYTKSY